MVALLAASTVMANRDLEESMQEERGDSASSGVGACAGDLAPSSTTLELLEAAYANAHKLFPCLAEMDVADQLNFISYRLIQRERFNNIVVRLRASPSPHKGEDATLKELEELRAFLDRPTSMTDPEKKAWVESIIEDLKRREQYIYN